MKVRTKTMLITLMSIAILIVIFFSACYVILVENFQNIENKEAKLMAEKAAQVMQSDIDGLEANAMVFANWNETYDFVNGKNSNYIETSLHDSTFINLNINILIIVNSQKEVIYRLAYDNGELPLPRGFYNQLTNTSLLLTNNYSTQNIKGVIMVQDLAYEIVALPILHNDQTGPIAGTLIVGRLLDSDVSSFISEQVSLPVSIEAHSDSSGNEDIQTSIVDQNNISAVKVVRDIYGNDVLDIRIVMSREISSNALSSQWSLLFLMVLIGIGMLFTTLYALDRLVLKKIYRLERGVRSIEKRGDPDGRVENLGDDELGNLATTINNMLDAVQRTESKLTESERRFKAVVQDQTEIIYRTTMDGEIAFANDQFKSFFGIDPTTLVGVKFLPVTGEEYEQMLSARMAMLTPAEPVFDFEQSNTRQDGELRYLHWSVRGVFDEAQVLKEYQWVGRDTTEKMRMLEKLHQTERIESLGVLAGGIAHDFNNMLTSLMGTLATAKKGMDPNDPRYHRIEEGERSIIRATHLTKQLLTFSKGGDPIKHPVDVPRFVRDAADFSSHGTGVNLIHDYKNVWKIDGDEGQLFQVISNLVINARQAMPSGGTIKLSACNRLISSDMGLPIPSGRYVEITVSDNGIGIPPENMNRIFDPYFTTKRDGTGLGLTIVHSVVLRHNGHIEVESEVGTGTKFHVFLPASNVKDEPEESAPKEEKEVTGHILVMDDDESILEVATELLSGYGFTVECASRGEDAIEMVRKAKASGNEFEVLVMDLTIKGGMGGIEAIAKIRSFDKGVKAIVSSGYSNDPAMANPEEYGFNDVVQKPYQVETMVRTIRRLIMEEREERENNGAA